MDEAVLKLRGVIPSEYVYRTFMHMLKGARKSVVLVAPFINYSLFCELLGLIDKNASFTLVTTWRPLEIAGGYNDLRIRDRLVERGGSEIRLIWNLHAKYYRTDNSVLLGSGNLTHSGLNARNHGNSEIMMRVDHDFPGLMDYEIDLMGQSIVPTQQLYEDMHQQVEILKQNGMQSKVGLKEMVAPVISIGQSWQPTCEMPQFLFDVYKDDLREIDLETISAARVDLSYLDMPSGLDGKSFNLFVRGVLSQSILFASTLNFLNENEVVKVDDGHQIVSDFFPNLNAEEKGRTWDAAKRWLSFFFDEKFDIAKY